MQTHSNMTPQEKSRLRLAERQFHGNLAQKRREINQEITRLGEARKHVRQAFHETERGSEERKGIAEVLTQMNQELREKSKQLETIKAEMREGVRGKH